jgi:uncharacterized protein (TIRG00374 family)
MLGPLFYVFVDWALMLLTLYASFYCVGQVVPVHVIVIGFCAGALLSVVNLVPGGLGLMEGSMAAIFSSMGVPLETALVATVIFRLTYYLLPLVLTVLLFPEVIRSVRRATYETAPQGRPRTASR